MYKNMLPADVMTRQLHPMEHFPCYAGPVDVAALQQQLTEQHERYLRLAADFENFKKRAAREGEKRAAAHTEGFGRDLLPVVDNLERALTISSRTATDPLRHGVEMTLRQFVQALRKRGFEPRDDVGAAFDPSYHEAVCTRAEPDHDHHSVIEVWQRGWMHGDRLFRPAKVVVNDHSARPSEETVDREGELAHV